MPKIPVMKRLKDVLSKGFMPRGFTLSDPEARRILLLGSMVIAKTVLADRLAFFDGYIVSTVLSKDWRVFLRAVAQGAFFRTFLAAFDAGMMRQKWYLNLEWRRRLTEYLMDLYFKKNTFYDVKNQDDRISDPEERITEQVEALSVSLTDLWTSLLRPAFDISFNLIVLYRTVGSAGVFGVGTYMTLSALALRYVIPNFRSP